eukprot:TRINITY_DN3628_c0_g1_i5.p1 TRINITY_DN3628_c0_g1~~TRINITY_DN3628_c0_g1_i5.p1  ORF type:complete len:156 (+),score=27.96 TRINITY_DN3628_c0_g1_i5:64-531(+)
MCIRDRRRVHGEFTKQMEEKSSTIVKCEMAAPMREDALSIAKIAIDKQGSEKEVSEEIKRFFDKKYSPNWHCVVGKNFCYYVSFQAKRFIFFYVGQIAVLLYKLQDLLQQSLQLISHQQYSEFNNQQAILHFTHCLLYTSPSPRDATLSRMPSSA